MRLPHAPAAAGSSKHARPKEFSAVQVGQFLDQGEYRERFHDEKRKVYSSAAAIFTAGLLITGALGSPGGARAERAADQEQRHRRRRDGRNRTGSRSLGYRGDARTADPLCPHGRH
jgi:hypothetical protein